MKNSPDDAIDMNACHNIIVRNNFIFNNNFIELRKKVTSKGGTTEAAMKYLENKNFNKLIEESINEAQKRAKKLA